MEHERFAGIRVDLVIYVTAILATFSICGLWHGANWTFIAWGCLHGSALAVHRAWKIWHPFKRLSRNSGFRLSSRIGARLTTLIVVTVGWVVFRCDSLGSAGEYLMRIGTWNSGGTRLLSPYILPACAAVFLVHVLVQRDRNWAVEVPHQAVVVRILSYASVLVLIASFGASDAAPFIYLQF
jgi:D-alanyl-lipoteichoic acid acyltransferase DltB (MBOAT superfamily)